MAYARTDRASLTIVRATVLVLCKQEFAAYKTGRAKCLHYERAQGSPKINNLQDQNYKRVEVSQFSVETLYFCNSLLNLRQIISTRVSKSIS